MILSSQYKRQGLAFLFHQTCWIGSKMGLWMQPGQAHTPCPCYINPGKKVIKGRAQRDGGQSSKNPRDVPKLLQSPAPGLPCPILQSGPPSPGSKSCPPPAHHPILPPTQCLLRQTGRGPLPSSVCFPPPELDGRLSNSLSLTVAAHFPSLLSRKHHPSHTAQKPSPQFWGPQGPPRWRTLAPRLQRKESVPSCPRSPGAVVGRGR